MSTLAPVSLQPQLPLCSLFPCSFVLISMRARALPGSRQRPPLSSWFWAWEEACVCGGSLLPIVQHQGQSNQAGTMALSPICQVTHQLNQIIPC